MTDSGMPVSLGRASRLVLYVGILNVRYRIVRYGFKPVPYYTFRKGATPFGPEVTPDQLYFRYINTWVPRYLRTNYT